MQDMLEFIRSRRSTRKFFPKPLEREKLDMILDAGRHAPSGGNNQLTHFIVITNPEVLSELAALVKHELSLMEYHEGMYKSLAMSIAAAKKESYFFHYNPAALVVTANQRSYGNAMVDCACALENMMLMANALDLGSCWINHLRWLQDNENAIAFMQKLGMAEGEYVCGALSIGYPDTESGLPARTPLPRTGNPITYID